MLCQACRKKEASVHFSEVVSNEKREIHLCEECAQAQGTAIKTHGKGPAIPKFLVKVVEGSNAADEEEDRTCSGCDLSLEAMRTQGKLGCSQCFSSFERELLKLLDRIHGGTTHRGKTPSRTAANPLSGHQELSELRQELRSAVAAEAYERAAELRDRVRRLETQLGSPPAILDGSDS